MKVRRREMLAAVPAMAAQPGGSQRTRVLVTCAANPLAMMIASSLSQEHTIRLTDRNPVSSGFEFVQSALTDPAATLAMMSGVQRHELGPRGKSPSGSSTPTRSSLNEFQRQGTRVRPARSTAEG